MLHYEVTGLPFAFRWLVVSHFIAYFERESSETINIGSCGGLQLYAPREIRKNNSIMYMATTYQFQEHERDGARRR